MITLLHFKIQNMKIQLNLLYKMGAKTTELDFQG